MVWRESCGGPECDLARMGMRRTWLSKRVEWRECDVARKCPSNDVELKVLKIENFFWLRF